MTEKPSRRPVIARIVIWTAVVLSAIIVVLMAYIMQRQAGFEGKSLWDWMGLLIVPLFLAGGVFLLDTLESRRQTEADSRQAEQDRLLAEQRAETERQLAEQRAEIDRQLAIDRIQEDRFQSYLDRMQDLLEKGLKSPTPDSDILRDVARVRTLTALRGLDGERKGALLLFLHESNLLHKDAAVVLLKGADLRRANLTTASLSEANLNEVDLTGANLHAADLHAANLDAANLNEADLRAAHLGAAHLRTANLRAANLRLADLHAAHLGAANLNETDLSGAKLSGANLRLADLRGAKLVGANLKQADLRGAKLVGARYGDDTQWPDGFDPIAAGAKK
jgi:hypothetical protein